MTASTNPHVKSNPVRLTTLALALLATPALLLNQATAANGTWSVDANGLWSGASNWSSSTIANDLTSTANFANNITADRTVSLDSDRTLNRVNFGDSETATAGSWILDNNGTATNNLILSGTTGAASGTAPVIDVAALGTGKTATISAIIEGSYGFTKTGAGTLNLTGSNTFSGAVLIGSNSGTVIAGHNNALGTASIGLNSNSQLVIQDGITINNSLTANDQGNYKGLVLLSGATSATYSGNISILETTPTNFDINASTGGTLRISGAISTGGFEKVGAGTVILTGVNTNGSTTITAGIVDFANKAAKSAGTATAGAAGSVGLGVKASDAAYYSATDVGNLFNTNTLTGFSLNAASGVAIDTTNAGAAFDQTVALTANRSLTKLGTGTLTLSGNNTYTGGTAISTGTLELTGRLGGGTYTGNITNSGSFLFGSSSNQTLSGNISGTGSLTKDGAGTLTLSGNNTYSGNTTISTGTLKLTGAGNTGSGAVSLGTVGTLDVSEKAGGHTIDTLIGSGTVIGNLTVSTQLAIGNSPGTVTFNNGLILGNNATYTYELTGGETPGGADLANVTGALNITGAILDLVQLGTYTANNKFTLFAYSGGLTGTFKDAVGANLLDGATFTDAGGLWTIDYDDGTAGSNGGTGSQFVTITAIPEPSALTLFGGLGALVMLRRRR